MYNLLLSPTIDTKWCKMLDFSTHKSYKNFNIDKNGKDDISELRSSIKIVHSSRLRPRSLTLTISNRTTAYVFGLEFSQAVLYSFFVNLCGLELSS